MLEGGFIKLHRKMTRWEWYHDTSTFILFIHLLLTVNYEPRSFQGRMIERGQRIASYSSLSKETRLSVKSVRTAINHLKSTGEVAIETTSKYSIITINNYDLYQQAASEQASEGQAKGKRRASEGQQWKKDKESKRKIKKEREGTLTAHGSFLNVFLSPSELSDLKTMYPQHYEAKIERLSRYLASTGKTYRDHYATLLDWLQEDTANEVPKVKSSYDINEVEKIDTLDWIK